MPAPLEFKLSDIQQPKVPTGKTGLESQDIVARWPFNNIIFEFVDEGSKGAIDVSAVHSKAGQNDSKSGLS